MKRVLLILLVTIILTACGSNEPDVSESSEEPTQTEETSKDKTEIDKNEEKEESAKKEAALEKADNRGIEGFYEFETIAEQIDLDVYTGIVQTDNQGNRVILFEDEHKKKEFKSVFIKNNKRLKIIKLTDDGLLYNDEIN